MRIGGHKMSENSNRDVTMEKIVALSNNRGFIFQGSEVYGGFANTWDYGPLGIELKNNIKKLWWKKFVQETPYNVGIDTSIFMNPSVWEASGHLDGFADPLMDCRECNERFRADHIIENYAKKHGLSYHEGMTNEEMEKFIADHEIPCPTCNAHNFTPIRQFNLMFQTYQGVTKESQSVVYLRPETAQGIFTNFKNVLRTTRRKIPFGIGQIGKSFRNEITPGNFIFRTREFEQMELQFFCEPGTDEKWFLYWKEYAYNFLLELGMKEENLRIRDHDPEELSHYSVATADIEFLFPFGWGELWGIANRTDYDLGQHQKHSGEDMTYYDQERDFHYLPYVIEPSVGADRMLLAFLCDAYEEEVIGTNKDGSLDIRNILHLHPALAPITVGVLPLSKKLSAPAEEIYHTLSKHFMCYYDDRGNIGRRYRRFDEIGTPFCITYDFDSEETNQVTVRFRDSMEQVLVDIDKLVPFIKEKIFL